MSAKVEEIVIQGNYVNVYGQEIIVDDVIDGVVVVNWIDNESADTIDEDDFRENFKRISTKTGRDEPTKREFHKLTNDMNEENLRNHISCTMANEHCTIVQDL